jgi:hypothetical protein
MIPREIPWAVPKTIGTQENSNKRSPWDSTRGFAVYNKRLPIDVPLRLPNEVSLPCNRNTGEIQQAIPRRIQYSEYNIFLEHSNGPIPRENSSSTNGTSLYKRRYNKINPSPWRRKESLKKKDLYSLQTYGNNSYKIRNTKRFRNWTLPIGTQPNVI